ncbi:hypothetical protein L7F22_018404 [Adiantum nelumboides]|nr:hypothetical protein [Adiantum nelumboides]
MLADMYANPFYFVLIDESTDRTMEKHLTVYVTYVSNEEKARAECCFVEMLPNGNADAKSIFDVITQFLDMNKVIAIAIDGASVITVYKTVGSGSSSQWLFSVHCTLVLDKRVGAAAVQGTGRPTMEDTFSIATASKGSEPSFFGVFDGHGGIAVAEMLKNDFWSTYKKRISGREKGL